MLIRDIISKDYLLLTENITLEREYHGIYCGDLLSVVMRSAKSGSILVSVISNPNTIAVSMLLDLPCVIITENQPITDAMVQKANAEDIALLSTKLQTHEVVIDLKDRGCL